MQDDKGETLQAATPSTPAVVMGLPEVPRAGDTFEVVADEKTARTMVEERKNASAAGREGTGKATLEDLDAAVVGIHNIDKIGGFHERR